jgi:hypothetical protein
VHVGIVSLTESCTSWKDSFDDTLCKGCCSLCEGVFARPLLTDQPLRCREGVSPARHLANLLGISLDHAAGCESCTYVNSHTVVREFESKENKPKANEDRTLLPGAPLARNVVQRPTTHPSQQGATLSQSPHLSCYPCKASTHSMCAVVPPIGHRCPLEISRSHLAPEKSNVIC